ncbi:M48 family metalloprotease [Streptosporangium sp. NPDC049248]|uniref:M48 family metalloprotease n=1 Tax=Streptosporangium sp. NPDC049248 TaxID=3155651 RepID=UPI00342087AE
MTATPFTLPTATTTRFVLLIGLSALTAIYLASPVSRIGPMQLECAVAADRQAVTGRAAQVVSTYLTCDRDAHLWNALFDVVVIALFLLVVVLLHNAAPAITSRRQHLLPLPVAAYPEASARVERLIAEAGLQGRVTILVNPHDDGDSGRAFGRFGSRRVRLSFGLIRRYPESEPELNAVMRHELAHVRNRDLNITGLTLASWWTFALAVTVMLVFVMTGPLRELPGRAIPLLLTLTIAFLTTVAIARVREHYADVRAAEANLAAEDPAFPPNAVDLARADSRWVRSWRRTLLWHPTVQSRKRVVDDPAWLLRPNLLDMFLTGVTSALTFPYLTVFATDLLGDEGRNAYLLAGTIQGPLVAAVAGTSLWRGVLRARESGLPVPGGIGSGMALAAGLYIGLLSLLFTIDGNLAQLLVRDIRLGVVAALLLMVICIAFCRWNAVTATAWLGVSARPRLPLAAAVPVGGLLFGTLFANWYAAAGGLPAEISLPFLQLVYQTVSGLADLSTLMALVLALLLPLSARLRRPLEKHPLSVVPRGAVVVPVGCVVILTTGGALLLPEGLNAWLTRLLLPLAPAFAGEAHAEGWSAVIATGTSALVAGFATALVVSRSNRSGLGPVYGLLTSYLVGMTLPLVFTVRATIILCGRSAPLCTPNSLAGYLGALALLHGAMALTAGTVGTLAGSGIGALLRTTRRKPVRAPAGGATDVQDFRPARRSGATALGAAGVLAVTLVLVLAGGHTWLQVNGVTAPSQIKGTPVFTEVTASAPTHRTPLRQSCEWIYRRGANMGLGSAYNRYLLDISLAATGSDSRGLDALGRALLDSLRQGDLAGREQSRIAVSNLCIIWLWYFSQGGTGSTA